jgi:hypothetical protein
LLTRFALLATLPAVVSCGSSADPCWGLKNGDHLSIDLVELYTPASSFTYQSIPTIDAQVETVDQLPSCGPAFDFQVGETLHVTTTGHGAADDPKVSCTISTIRVDSPQRLAPEVAPGVPLGLVPKAVLYSYEAITVGACAGRRELALVPLDGYPGMVADPVPGNVPPLVLVRSAFPLSDDGAACSAVFPAPDVCADQFVIRLAHE